MKKYFFVIIALLFTLFPIHAVKKIDANPVNVAATLVEKTDSAEIAAICEYYGYILQAQENGYTVYKHPANGSIIRFIFDETEPNQQFVTIEVISKVSSKEIERILNELNFKTNGNSHERQSFGYITRCSGGNHGYLVFKQYKKSKRNS